MSTSGLTTEQQIRIAALNAAVGLTARAEYKDGTKTIATARVLEEYIRGEPEYDLPVVILAGENFQEVNHSPVDLTGFIIKLPNGDAHTHLPTQHRDRKPKWCNGCGLTAHLRKPEVARGSKA